MTFVNRIVWTPAGTGDDDWDGDSSAFDGWSAWWAIGRNELGYSVTLVWYDEEDRQHDWYLTDFPDRTSVRRFCMTFQRRFRGFTPSQACEAW